MPLVPSFCALHSVISCCFSGNINSETPKGIGGDILVTVTSDNKHTVHIWKWMTHDDKFCKATYIPGWSLGPEKKLKDLESKGLFYGDSAQGESP